MNGINPTEAADVEQALRNSRREMELLLEAIPDMLLRVRRDGTYLSFKPPRDFRPWKHDQEVIGKSVRDSIPPEAAQRAMAGIAAALATGKTQQFFITLPVDDDLWQRDVRIVPATADEVLIMIRDVTEHRRAQQQRDAYIRLAEAIRRVQSRSITQPEYAPVFRTALEELLALTSSEHGFLTEVFRNPDGTPALRTLAWTDASPGEPLRIVDDELSGSGWVFAGLEHLWGAAMLQGEVVISASPIAAGRRVHNFLGVPMRHEGGVIGVAGFGNRPGGYDEKLVEYIEPLLAACGAAIATHHFQRQRIDTEQRLEQQQLQLAHVVRLSTLGEMVAGLAHELTQPLGAICNYASAAEATLQQAAPLSRASLLQWNRQIGEQASRAGAIIDRLRQFVRRGEPRDDLLDVRRIVTEAIELAEVATRRLRSSITCQCASDAKIQGDRVQIQQVLLNLISNGAEAMAAAPQSNRQVLVRVAHDEHEVVISVVDDGAGIAPDVQEKVFEAFYTTKPDGLGMGLAICRSIAVAHGGRLWCTRNSSRGMTFHLALPRSL
jgi:signal transduction histidine kinase